MHPTTCAYHGEFTIYSFLTTQELKETAIRFLYIFFFIHFHEQGGDQGGSIRIPASYCGVVGLKPTHGLVPYTGAAPIMPCTDHLGPMAKTVNDCALMLEVIAGKSCSSKIDDPNSAI